MSFASLACLTLAAIRIDHVISFTTPLQLVSSGAEEEALASVWRLVNGQVVYTDPRAIPFTASYFNWLFYSLYGGAVWLLPLKAVWLPTICRLITLAITLGGAVVLARTLRVEALIGSPLAWRLAGLAFFNPLCGFWIVTTRPDVGAAVLELGAVAIFLRHRQTSSRASLIAVALLLEAAWAFKQTSVGALAGIVLAMVLPHRRLRGPEIDGYRLILLPAIFGGAAILAWLALGPIYRHGLYLSQLNSGFQWSWALLHFGLALVKMPFIAVALCGAVLLWRRSDAALQTVTLVLVSTFLLELVASRKGGAGDYYFLSLGLWSVLWIGLALKHFQLRALHLALLAAALLQVASVATILFGHRGTTDPHDPARPYEQLANYLAAQPGPIFVQNTYGDLPWISPTSPHFVIAYNNEVDARAGITFEDGGWQGMMARGYFATVVIKAANRKITDEMLARYRLAHEEAGFRYYERVSR